MTAQSRTRRGSATPTGEQGHVECVFTCSYRSVESSFSRDRIAFVPKVVRQIHDNRFGSTSDNNPLKWKVAGRIDFLVRQPMPEHEGNPQLGSLRGTPLVRPTERKKSRSERTRSCVVLHGGGFRCGLLVQPQIGLPTWAIRCLLLNGWRQSAVPPASAQSRSLAVPDGLRESIDIARISPLCWFRYSRGPVL